MVRKLGAHIDEIDVIRTLCMVSVRTDSHKLRSSIIAMLKNRSGMANQYFSYIAIYAKRSEIRKWALVNLSLMECRDAQIAVTQGLQDRSRDVQQAAALNIGLYQDSDFVREVERFFERNRFEFMFHSLCRFQAPQLVC